MLLQRAGIKPIKEQRRKQQEEEVERQERAERWRVNRGEAAAKVPFLPKELWSLIYNQRNIESERYKAWQRWANKRLMQDHQNEELCPRNSTRMKEHPPAPPGQAP